MNFRVFISKALLIAVMSTAVVNAQDSSSVEQRIEAVDQRIRILERKLELEKEDATAKQKAAPVLTASSSGFSFKSGDGAYLIKFRGYFHSDSRVFISDKTQLGTDTFVLRRVRPIVEGTLAKNFDYRIMLDFGQGTATLQDLHLDANFIPQLKIRFGKFKSPFALERLQSATALTFIERAFPTSLGPNRDTGVMVFGELFKGALEYSVGAFNGVLDGSSGDLDATDSKDITGRIFALPFVNQSSEALKGLGFGVAGDIGNQDGTAAAPNVNSYRTSGQAVFFRYRSDATAAGTASATGQRVRISPQGYYYAGPFSLMAEYTISSQEMRRDVTAAKIRHSAWQATVSFVLTGDKTSFRGVTPKKAFDPAKGTWGAFEIAFRVHALDLDDDAFPVFANPASSATKATALVGGISWYLNKHAKFIVNYEQTSFDGGAATGDRPTEKLFVSRFQLSY